MPLYEYECDVCRHRFEIIQKFSDPPAEKCPSCGGPVHKLQSAPAFQFKGSGWYVTDYARSGQSGEGAKSGAKEGSKDSGQDSGKDSGQEGGKDGGKDSRDAGKGTASDASPAKPSGERGGGSTSGTSKPSASND